MNLTKVISKSSESTEINWSKVFDWSFNRKTLTEFLLEIHCYPFFQVWFFEQFLRYNVALLTRLWDQGLIVLLTINSIISKVKQKKLWELFRKKGF